MDFEVLQYFGVNTNDRAIYKALLKLGRSKTGPIMKESGVGSSRTYESLRNLVKKGLVSYVVRNNIKYYQAESPKTFIDDIEKHKTQLDNLAKEISTSPIIKTDRNDTNIYEGPRGFKIAFANHMEPLKTKEEILIIAFNPRLGSSKELRGLFRGLDAIMFKKKIKARMIIEKTYIDVMKKDHPDISFFDIRTLPSSHFNPMAVNITKYEVMLSVWGKNPVAFTMHNPAIIESFKNNFEYLWGIAKKI